MKKEKLIKLLNLLCDPNQCDTPNQTRFRTAEKQNNDFIHFKSKDIDADGCYKQNECDFLAYQDYDIDGSVAKIEFAYPVV